jgi:hypothetical protein
VARVIWKPLPQGGLRASRLLGKLGQVQPEAPLLAGPVMWVRVCAGAALAVFGSMSATLLLDLATRAASQHYTLSSPSFEIQYMQDKILTWEIKAMSFVLGGVLAGSNTRNGFKQGLFVGIATMFVLSAMLASQGFATIGVLASVLVSALCLSMVGGWFGSQLLPPVVPFKPTRGMGPASLA